MLYTSDLSSKDIIEVLFFFVFFSNFIINIVLWTIYRTVSI